MKGSYKIVVRNKYNKFDFVLKRNITVLKGHSATGKTTMFDMIDGYNKYGRKSGVSLRCDVPILAFKYNKNWYDELQQIKNSIIVIDEECEFINTIEFARAIKNTNNYYLLITRNYLKELPYSVEEIYELEGNINKKFVKLYDSSNYLYNAINNFVPDVIVTEDCRSGFQFFDKIKKKNIKCISSDGKEKIIDVIREIPKSKILVIADGAAFGSEIESVYNYICDAKKEIVIFLPESFEWLILKSGIIEKNIIELNRTENYVESSKYFSWETYFFDLLVEKTKGDKLRKYEKKNLKPFYFQENNVRSIINLFNKIIIH